MRNKGIPFSFLTMPRFPKFLLLLTCIHNTRRTQSSDFYANHHPAILLHGFLNSPGCGPPTLSPAHKHEGGGIL